MRCLLLRSDQAITRRRFCSWRAIFNWALLLPPILSYLLCRQLLYREKDGNGLSRRAITSNGDNQVSTIAAHEVLNTKERCDRYKQQDGITLYALSGSSTPTDRLFDGILATIQSSPSRHLPTALITDFNLTRQQEGLFDCVIRVEDGRSDTLAQYPQAKEREWQGLWHLPFSPFAKTVVLQPYSAICSDLKPIFDLLSDYDILLSPSDEEPFINLGLMAFSKGKGLDALHDSLIRILPLGSSRLSLDLALRTMNKQILKSGVFPTSWLYALSQALHPLHSHLRHTLVLHGEVKVGFQQAPSKFAADSFCKWINGQDLLGTSRMAIYDSENEKTSLIQNLTACKAAIGDECAKSVMLWATEQDKPLMYDDYMRFHRKDFYESQQRLKAQLRGFSYGVSYFGYSPDQQRVQRYISEIEKSAWGLKMFNPSVRVALFTNKPMQPYPPFDDIVPMNDTDIGPVCCKRGEAWNILARVQYHLYSPYDITVQIDSDRVVYGDISHLFELLASDKWDILGVSGGHLPTVDLGVFGMKKSVGFTALISAWVAKMREFKHEGVDDQYSFARVFNTIPNLRMGFLNPTWQLVYRPSGDQNGLMCLGTSLEVCNMTLSLVMAGPIMIGPGTLTTLDNQLSYRRELNKHMNTKRVFIRNLLDDSYFQATSKEDCDRLTRGQCNHSELDWNSPRYDVLDINQMKERFPRVDWNVV